MSKRGIYDRLFVTSAAIASLLAASSALAQASSVEGATGAANPANADEAAIGAGEIVVTAQKRQESVNRVGMSISAFSGEALANRGVVGVEQLVKVVPGFNYSKGAYGAPVFTIRGIGFNEQSLAAAPTVSVYVDEVALPYSIMTEGASLDVERVEVLKGPQGTLFGQNSTGGAINFVAARPTKSAEAGFDVSVARFDSVTASGFVSGPLSETLGARLAVRREYSGPWQVSASRPDDRQGKVAKSFARLLLEWKPSDQLTILLNANGWTNRSDSQAGQFVGVVNPRATALAAQPLTIGRARIADWDPGTDFSVNDDFWQFALRADYAVSDEVNLTSITAYSNYKRDALIDGDGTPIQGFAALNEGAIKSFSQEMRLSGQAGDGVKWLLGGNYQRDTIDDVFAPFAAESSFPFDSARADGTNKVSTYSGFGSVDWELISNLTFTAAVRYSWQDRSYQGCLFDTGAGDLARVLSGVSTRLSGTPTIIPPGGCVTLSSVTFKPAIVQDSLNEGNFSWKGALNWQIEPNKLLYASISKGYKNGVFITTGATFDLSVAPATQESVLAYEAGFKFGLFDRTLQLNGAAFYYGYNDKQIRGRIIDPVVGPLNRILNIPKSRVAGGEIQLIWEPTRGINLNTGVTYVNSKILGNFVNFTPLGNQKLLSGEPFPLMPKWQAFADMQYDFPIGSTVNMFVGGNVNYQSKTNSSLGQERLLNIKGYMLADLRLGFRDADDAWRISTFVQNVSNIYYWTNVAVPGPDAAYRYAGSPRTYGVMLGFKFR